MDALPEAPSANIQPPEKLQTPRINPHKQQSGPRRHPAIPINGSGKNFLEKGTKVAVKAEDKDPENILQKATKVTKGQETEIGGGIWEAGGAQDFMQDAL